MKTALTAAEYAALRLPGLAPDKPGAVLVHERDVRRRADREKWAFLAREGKGGGKLYPLAGRPQAWREALMKALMRGDARVLDILGAEDPAPSTAPVVRPSPVPETPPPGATDAKTGLPVRRCGRRSLVLAIPDPETLTTRQRAARDARAAVLVELDRLIAADSGVNRAVETLIGAVRAGTLRPELLALVPVANDRAKEGRDLSRATLMRWLSLRKSGGVDSLAPRPTAETDTDIPDWAPALIQEFQRPQKPSLSDALNDMVAPPGIKRPSYQAARRFLDKLAPFCREKGRMGPNALKALRAYTVRDTSELWPTAVYTSDGHTFKAWVEHPIHGGHFEPEVTPVLDVATRYCVSFSVGLVENSIGVLEALSGAMAPAAGRPGGIPAIFYTDLGKGFKNELMSAAATGFYARWGITEKHSRARNSQARGVMEHWHATVLKPAAKRLPTYCGDEMDKDAIRLMKKANSEAKRDGLALPFTVSWAAFHDHIRAEIDAYNSREHSALPRIADPVTGKRRPMTPAEAWAAGVEKSGYKPIAIEADDIADLMRPYEERSTRRGFVQILGNSYFSPTLEAFDGDRVQVGFDINDASKVWVRDIEHGRLLAVATLDGASRPYFPTAQVVEARSFTERRMAARTKGRLGRVDDRREEILAEARPQLTLVASQPAVPLRPEQEEAAAALLARFEVSNAPAPAPVFDGGRPRFTSDTDLARWVMANPAAATGADLTLLRELLRRPSFRDVLESEGVDPSALREAIAC